MIKITVFFLAFTCVGQFLAQTGGVSTFALLNLGYSARVNALGTNFITVKDQDVNLGIANPSLLNSKMNHTGAMSQALLAGGINYGMITYARHYDSLGTFSGNLRYINYGRMDRTDIAGNSLGTFNPSEYILGMGFGKQINPQISVGTTLNLIYSQLETYNSLGASIDIAGTYTHDKSNLLVTALVKNAGVQLNSYLSKTKSPLPVDFQLGVAHKLHHAPFRFSVVAHHLNKWNITYTDPNLKPTVNALTGDTIPVKQASFAQKLGSHFIFQCEILLSKNLHLRAAFDVHKRQDLKIAARPGMAGFSLGTGLNFKRFSLDYGLSIFSKAGFNNMITFTTNFDNWKKSL